MHNVTKLWSRLDQVFISDHSESLLIACDTQPDHRCINTDHLPILTELNLHADVALEEEIHNFCEVDWDKFCKEPSTQLAKLPPPTPIDNQRQLNDACNSLTKAIQRTIIKQVPVTIISPKSKRWWTKELTQLCQLANKLGRQSYDRHHDSGHTIHGKHIMAAKNYHRILEQTKRQHWRDWLEKADDPDIWMAHRLMAQIRGDGSKARIPTLIHKVSKIETTANTNSDKGSILAKVFFLEKPPADAVLETCTYPKQCESKGMITLEQIESQLKKLKPFKVPGPDSIPNVVLTKNADLIIVRLLPIYKAMLEKSLIYKPWKEFAMVVLRKPGKPRYDTLKAYRPIALLNTMWKVITAIIANHITYIMEKHQLLPANHFGGCPG